MANGIAVDTLDTDTVDVLHGLFGAATSSMAKLCNYISFMAQQGSLDNLPPQRPHLEIPRFIGKPASSRRAWFSSGEEGHPSAAFLRRGLAEK